MSDSFDVPPGANGEAVPDLRKNLAVALDLASRGFAVFPCEPAGDGRKRPKPGIMWATQASSRPQDVTRLWRRWPDAAPGIKLEATPLIVIDCDPPKTETQQHGVDWFFAACADHDYDPMQVPAVQTPSGGLHLYFRRPVGSKIGNGRGALPPKAVCGVDVRGAGGYPPERYVEPIDGDQSWMGKQLDAAVKASLNLDDRYVRWSNFVRGKGTPDNEQEARALAEYRAPRSLVPDSQTKADIAAGRPPSYLVVALHPNGHLEVLQAPEGGAFRWRPDRDAALKAVAVPNAFAQEQRGWGRNDLELHSKRAQEQ